MESETKKLKYMDVTEFVRRLNDETSAEKNFVLFLGAGCSVTSGIPAAGALVREHWIPRLHRLQAPNDGTPDEWAEKKIEGYDKNNPAASYGDLIERVFLCQKDRQTEIERLCDNKIPSFGYAVLA